MDLTYLIQLHLVLVMCNNIDSVIIVSQLQW